MHSPLRLAIFGGAAALALCLGALASAQTPAPADQGRPHMMRGGAGEHGHWMHRDPAEMQKHAADHLRTLLQLTPQQEPALQTFLASMKRPERERHMDMAALKGPDGKPDPAKMKAEMEKRHAEMEAKRKADMAMTTPQRLDEMAKHMAERQASMQAHIAAVKSFYAALTPSQQKVFDTLHGGGMHHGFGGRERGHEGGPGMHGRGEMHMGMMSPPPGAPAAER